MHSFLPPTVPAEGKPTVSVSGSATGRSSNAYLFIEIIAIVP